MDFVNLDLAMSARNQRSFSTDQFLGRYRDRAIGTVAQCADAPTQHADCRYQAEQSQQSKRNQEPAELPVELSVLFDYINPFGQRHPRSNKHEYDAE